MEQSNLLYIPYRQTPDMPLAQILKEVITDEFYQSATAFDKDLNAVHAMRKEVEKIVRGESGGFEADLRALKEYYCQICVMERKFPRDSVEFTWTSNNLTYQPNNKVALRSFDFEKLGVLYIIAALFSQHAFHQDRSDLEGLRKASMHFQAAAGVFGYILDLMAKIRDFTVPLEYSGEVVTALQSLMLAQAQEAYWQRAMSSSSDKIVAILAHAVGDFYRQSYEAFNKSQFILRSEFLNHVNCKSLHFLAAAHYRMTQHEYAASRYGEQVAHARQANAYITKGLKSTRGVNETVYNDLNGLSDAVKQLLKTAEKENDLIYHKDVPNAAPEIVGRPMVKPSPMPDLDTPLQTLKETFKTHVLFENLLPYIVIQSAQAFKERQEQFVSSNLINPVNTLTKILQEFINERGLPASLDAVQKPQRLPDGLLQNCQDLLSNDALTKVQKSIGELSRLSDESRHLIEGCKERLEIEEQENEAFRERQGSRRWTRPSSAEAAGELRAKISHYEQYLTQAADGDNTVRRNIAEIRPYLELMFNAAIPGSNGKEALRKFVPMSDLVQLSPEITKTIKALKGALNEAAGEIDKRQFFIEAVELKSREAAILPKVISEYRIIQSNEDAVLDESTFEPVFVKHLKNFDSDLTNLYQIRDSQTSLEARIDSLNKTFVAAVSKTAEASAARTEALQTLQDAFNGYKENYGNITEGLEFYHGFIANVQGLLKQCDDFVYQRRAEGRALEEKLNGSLQQAAPMTPSKPNRTVAPPSSVSHSRYRTSLSDEEEDETFYSDAEDSYEQNAQRADDDGSRSPLKQKKRNNGGRVPTKADTSDGSPIRKEKPPAFWDPKHGIKFD